MRKKTNIVAGKWIVSDLEQMDVLHEQVGIHVVANDPGFSVAEYAAKYGFSTRYCRDRLMQLVSEGRLLKGFRRAKNNIRIMVFRFPEE